MNEVIDTFMIPEEIAKKLSDLLVTQSIRERLLTNLIGKPEYDQVERSLIDIISQIDTLKNIITSDYVPSAYRSEEYQWNYDGYGISGTVVQIMYA